jgi:hypothetical protein
MLFTVASKKFCSSTSFQNLVRLLQIEKIPLPDYALVNKVSKKWELMSYNMMIGYVRIFTTVLQWSIFHCINAWFWRPVFVFFLLATVSILDRGMQIKINLKNVFYTLHLFQVVPWALDYVIVLLVTRPSLFYQLPETQYENWFASTTIFYFVAI